MLDFLTYFVYVGLLFTVTSLLYLAAKSKPHFQAPADFGRHYCQITTPYSLNFFHFFALILISLVVAIRYDVGTDWDTYVELFNQYKSPFVTMDSQAMEPGYYLINKLVISVGGGYPLMFGLAAFISWYFTFKSITYRFLPLLIFFLFVDEYFFISMNLVRQFIALGIFVYSVKFIIEKKFLKYLLWLCIAASFHLSAIILLPLYFLPYKKLYNHKIWLVIYTVSLFFANVPILIDLFLNAFIRVSEMIPVLDIYVRYILNERFNNFRLEIGMGYVFRICVSFFLLFFSKKVIQLEPKTKVYYMLFFISLVIYNFFYMIPLIIRINHYFTIFRAFVLTFTAWFLLKSSKWKYAVVMLMVLYFVLYLIAIYKSSHNTAPYQTVF